MSKLQFQIGDKVLVKAITVMDYNTEGQRIPFRKEVDPKHYWITGAVHRRLGKYKKAWGHTSFDGDEYDPPELQVTGTVLMYRCRAGMLSKEIDVAPEDILIPEECNV